MKPSKWMPPIVRLAIRVRIMPSDCWEWTGGRHSQSGYGRMCLDGKKLLAHVAAYNLFVGEVPEGHILHHTCLNTMCVNPDHLCPRTRSVHISVDHRKEFCKYGHPLTPENTYAYPRRKERICKQCVMIRQRLYRERHPDIYAAQRQRACDWLKERYIPKPKEVRTHCIHGHELSGDNLYIHPNGQHCCRTCTRAASKRYAERHPERAAIRRERRRARRLDQENDLPQSSDVT